jgi:hypothetical protein
MGAGRLAALPVIVVAWACISSVATTAIPLAPASAPRPEAFVVLRGFGYSGAAERALRALEPTIAAQGMDLYIPDYISRSGLDDSGKKLQRFMLDRGLARYERLHVFAFIAGGWTLNPLVAAAGVPKPATIIYDRSPLQERAPRIADEKLHFLTWARYGSPVFDLARTPYPPLTASGVKVGLVVETSPTSFIRDHEQAARSYGAFRFECDAFGQRHDDCMYVDVNHDELYVRFAEVWPEALAFIRTGRFSSAASRTPPRGDPLAPRMRQ